jgi:ABC-2 type transport system permease protein
MTEIITHSSQKQKPGWVKRTWRTFDIYRRLVLVQIRGQLQYRISFLFDVIATGLITTLSFGTLALVLQRFENIGGWQLAEVAFLFGMVETAFGTMDMLFSGFDPQGFGRQVRFGVFDQLLLRPVGITTQVMGSVFILRRLGRIAQGMVILGFAFAALEINWTLLKILYFPVVFASLVCFFGGLFIIGATFSFWTVEALEVVNIFTYGGSEMVGYPMHIYPVWMRRTFTFIIPAIFLNYYPALFFMEKADPFGLPAFAPFLAPLVGLGTLFASLAFWRFGIRHYQSTGT